MEKIKYIKFYTIESNNTTFPFHLYGFSQKGKAKFVNFIGAFLDQKSANFIKRLLTTTLIKK